MKLGSHVRIRKVNVPGRNKRKPKAEAGIGLPIVLAFNLGSKV